VTLEATIGNTILPYDLDYTLISDFSPSQEQAIDDAITYWQEIIRGNLTSVEDTQQLLNPCGTGEPSLSSVDDMHVFVGTLPAEDQDGPGGVLASAGPCAIRPITNLPYLGLARFDPGDLDVLSDEEVFRIMLHEIGHTLGIGATWNLEGLLQDPSTIGSGDDCQQQEGFQDTYYTGDGARAAFLDVGGGSYSGGAIVPVANVESCGSADSHWREGVFDTELMTPGYDSGRFNPLSVVSVRSLEDLGYGVDASQAEAYSLPASGPLTAAPTTTVVLDLRGDVMPIQLDAIGPKHVRRGIRK
jgi:hypothetical protein